jgi:hypothetical protein
MSTHRDGRMICTMIGVILALWPAWPYGEAPASKEARLMAAKPQGGDSR